MEFRCQNCGKLYTHYSSLCRHRAKEHGNEKASISSESGSSSHSVVSNSSCSSSSENEKCQIKQSSKEVWFWTPCLKKPK